MNVCAVLLALMSIKYTFPFIEPTATYLPSSLYQNEHNISHESCQDFPMFQMGKKGGCVCVCVCKLGRETTKGRKRGKTEEQGLHNKRLIQKNYYLQLKVQQALIRRRYQTSAQCHSWMSQLLAFPPDETRQPMQPLHCDIVKLNTSIG